MPSEARFIVKAIPDQTAVVVFTPSIISPLTIKEVLEEVSAKFRGSNVAHAGLAFFPMENGAASSRFAYGAAGLLKFSTKPAADVLAKAVEAIKDSLIAHHFGIYSDE